jgi:Lysozyme like domain
VPIVSPGAARSVGTAGYVTPWEVATMMRRAGFPAKELVTGVSVAIAESTLRVGADNGTHFGLFQIAGDKGYDNAKLKSDPQYNVNAAYQVWKSQGWARGWLNYENGASYTHTAEAAAGVAQSKKAVPDAKLRGWSVHSNDISAVHEAAGAVPGGSATYDAVKGSVSGVGDLISILTTLDTWVRVGEVVGGSVMFIAGMILLGKEST